MGGFILQKVQARNKLEKCLINFGQKLAIRAIVEWQKNCPIVPLPGCTFSHHLIGKWIPGKGMIIKIVPNGNMQSSSCLKIFENQIRVYLLQCHTSYCFSKVLMHRYERDNRHYKGTHTEKKVYENADGWKWNDISLRPPFAYFSLDYIDLICLS